MGKPHYSLVPVPNLTMAKYANQQQKSGLSIYCKTKRLFHKFILEALKITMLGKMIHRLIPLPRNISWNYPLPLTALTKK